MKKKGKERKKIPKTKELEYEDNGWEFKIPVPIRIGKAKIIEVGFAL